MKVISNECCDCAVPSYPCLGKSCPLSHVVHYYCDKCKEEIDPDDIYRVDDEDLCRDCLLKMFKIDPEED